MLQDQLCTWENITLAYENAARGKRYRPATARFEYRLADHLIELQYELETQTWQPGAYESFYIHEPKRRLISAAPFRDRVIGNRRSRLLKRMCEAHSPTMRCAISPCRFSSATFRPTALPTAPAKARMPP